MSTFGLDESHKSQGPATANGPGREEPTKWIPVPGTKRDLTWVGEKNKEGMVFKAQIAIFHSGAALK